MKTRNQERSSGAYLLSIKQLVYLFHLSISRKSVHLKAIKFKLTKWKQKKNNFAGIAVELDVAPFPPSHLSTDLHFVSVNIVNT